ncbi:MAG TPA: protein kinase [Gemmatimonadales bacterium]|nr:protein kinase [Gemmatimonadales bacterium]
MTTPPRGTLADRYVIERELGQGGMATVYLATDLRHERQVAVKVLRSDLSASIGSERFLQEIRIAARLGHPHILPLHDSGTADGLLYYVMPYIAGESLRQRLARQGELPVADAVRILRDVADALAYAHEHGVVHRDIKPENILLSGRHALVADFGVAKAVSEATGRSQLTTAGVALGTPAYMAPEQAVADPHVDHRADIYALGVVGYEMLSGEPPFTGGTPQQVLAAHVTSAPPLLSARRPAIPPLLADALMRCLEKRPADRWQSAGDFLAQLEMLATPSGGSTPTHTQPVSALPLRRQARWPIIAAGVGVVALAVAAGIWGSRLFPRKGPAPTVLLRDRTQVTFTGRVRTPVISPDGKQLAFVTQLCNESACSYAVDVQDVGGSATRRVLEGAASVLHLEWSPDRRHLLATGTIERRWGTYLVSLLGGAPRRVAIGGVTAGGGAAFIAGGDSLVLMPAVSVDSAQWLGVSGLDGAVRDSIRLETGGRRIGSVFTLPGDRWIVAELVGAGAAEQVVLDRSGTVASRRPASFGLTRASADAIWRVDVPGERATITRIPFDPERGSAAERADSIYTGRFTSFSVTADGSLLAVDEGAWQHSVYALELPDVLSGRFHDNRRLLHGSVPFNTQLSPDGRRVLVRRTIMTPSGTPDNRMSLIPFDGGQEVSLPLPAGVLSAYWPDTATIAYTVRNAEGGITFARFDVRSGARRDEHVIADSIVWDWTALPGEGYGWVPMPGQELRVHRDGATRSYPKPAWYEVIFGVSSGGGRIAVHGWNAGSADTMGITEIVLADGREIPWFRAFTDGGNFKVHSDGSMTFVMFETTESASLHLLAGPGSSRRLGAIPRPISGIFLSDDRSRAVVGTRQYFGDVWVARVERR